MTTLPAFSPVLEVMLEVPLAATFMYTSVPRNPATTVGVTIENFDFGFELSAV